MAENRPPVQYIRRWGLYRKHSVAADKAQWDEDFSRLLPPPSTAAPEPIHPPAPPPTPTPDEVFTRLRQRLNNL